MFWASYKLIAKLFKWVALVLFAYMFASFYAHVDWKQAPAVTFVPHLEWSRGFLAVLVAILGTTISRIIARSLLIVVGSVPVASEQQSARQPFLAGVEKLVDQVVLDSALC